MIDKLFKHVTGTTEKGLQYRNLHLDSLHTMIY